MVKKIDIKPAVLDSGSTVSVQILKYIDGALSEDNTYTFDANDLEVSRASSNTYVAKIVFGTAYTEWIDGSTTQCFFDGVVCSPNDAYTLAGLVEADVTTYASGGGGGSYTFPSNSGNTAYVSTGGNDGTGVVGNISKPFLTAQAGLASMNAAIPGTIIILSSTGAQSIGDKRYLDGDAPERLSIQDLCACGITFIGEISLGEVFIDTNEIISINTDTSCVFAFLHAHCAQFLIPDTMAGTLVAASSFIDCNIFVIEDNANASVVLDVITWTTGAAIGVIDAFSYNDCTAWEYDTTLNQTSTNAPVAGVINKNTLGETLTYGYTNAGDYTINSPGNKFTLGYTVVTFGAGPYDGLAIATVGLITAISVGTIEFGVYSPNAFMLDNNLLVDTAVNIKVYPEKY
jgi:hypothetical protein